MKRIIVYLLFLSSFHLYSQSISVDPHQSNVNPSNSTSNLGDLGTEITVQNISENTIYIKVSREVISITENTKNYFCWTACYLPETSVSPQTISFAPMQVNNSSFQVHFDPLGISPSSATIKYCAFNADNESDSACAIVYFQSETVNVQDYEVKAFSEIHPNPASTTALLDYKLESHEVAEVVVTNMLGTEILREKLQNKEGVLRFDVSQTPSGLYFANILVNDELKSIKRLVVSH